MSGLGVPCGARVAREHLCSARSRPAGTGSGAETCCGRPRPARPTASARRRRRRPAHKHTSASAHHLAHRSELARCSPARDSGRPPARAPTATRRAGCAAPRPPCAATSHASYTHSPSHHTLDAQRRTCGTSDSAVPSRQLVKSEMGYAVGSDGQNTSVIRPINL